MALIKTLLLSFFIQATNIGYYWNTLLLQKIGIVAIGVVYAQAQTTIAPSNSNNNSVVGNNNATTTITTAATTTNPSSTTGTIATGNNNSTITSTTAPSVAMVMNNDTTGTTSTTAPAVVVTNGNNSSSSEPSTEEEVECYDNYTTIAYETKNNNASTLGVIKTFIICPNTYVVFGSPSGDGPCCEGGQHPLEFRSNTIYKCGATGNSTNNCTITGTNFLAVGLATSFNEPMINIVVQGITFLSAGVSGVVLGNKGDITFLDCIFKNHQNFATVLIAYDPTIGTRRRERQRQRERQQRHDVLDNITTTILSSSRLYYNYNDGFDFYNYEWKQYLIPPIYNNDNYNNNQLTSSVKSLSLLSSAEKVVDSDKGMVAKKLIMGEYDYNHHHHQIRHLQVEERLLVVFDTCQFINNSLPPTETTLLPGTQPGIIYASTGYQDIVVQNCIFTQNIFNNKDASPDGYAIRLEQGNSLVMTNNCIANNSFVGKGAVILNGTTINELDNNYADVDKDLLCSFIYDQDTNACIESDSTTSCIPRPPVTTQPNGPSPPTAAPASSSSSINSRLQPIFGLSNSYFLTATTLFNAVVIAMTIFAS